ncbi:MAG: adenylosuccinate lyase [Bacteroidota bacterium]
MSLNSLHALSPLDGRYQSKLAALSPFFSEAALIRYRVWVEVEYLIALHEQAPRPLQALSASDQTFLRSLYLDFQDTDAQRVKEIEAITNHDVKAVEYLIKEKIETEGRSNLVQNKEFVHFGLTSQDINNTANPMMIRDAIQQVYLVRIEEIISVLTGYAERWKSIPMLARTHGQAASPTNLGKEIEVYVVRLQTQVDELKSLPYPAKFGGATGNLNAHFIAYPDTDWHQFAKHFVHEYLGLHRSFPTTQIEHYDGLARIFDCLRRINTIVIDLCQDMWIYISQDYFKQKVKAGEVGSSAMPHKVNPIDFENAEGNCGLSTALFEFLSRKLPISRLQRDLTDSTVLRNVGVALGYAYLAQGSLLKGLGKLLVNEAAFQADLDKNWAVLAEAIQTILRREAYPNPYETLRDLTRGNAGINEKSLAAFVEGLDVSEEVKTELRSLRPETYIGR